MATVSLTKCSAMYNVWSRYLLRNYGRAPCVSKASMWGNARLKTLDENPKKQNDVFKNSRVLGKEKKRAFPKPESKSEVVANEERTKRNYSVEDEADIFGSLEATGGAVSYANNSYDIESEDEDDAREANFASTEYRSNKPYAALIKQYIKKKQLVEALRVLEVQMKEEGVQPNAYIYTLLICACGHQGYTKKAFQLYNQMKKRAWKIPDVVYTSLFNACANSPWTEDGLTRAKHLRSLMKEKGVMPNTINYHSMIKAFGRCGDIVAAFDVVDEMKERRLAFSEETYNFLLQACISDKEAGFRHALLTWRKMRRIRIKPTLYSYNLMLRCARDCGIGDSEAASDVFRFISAEGEAAPKQLQANSSQNLVQVLPLSQDTDSQGNVPSSITPQNETAVTNFEATNELRLMVPALPNFLSHKVELGEVVSLDVKTKEDRLMMLGGMEGLMSEMEMDNAKPNIKTFSQLVELLPPNTKAEEDLLLTMKAAKVKPDIDFFNMLIKKRSFRYAYQDARDVLQLVQAEGLFPNFMTFGVLALTCTNRKLNQQFLLDMEKAHFRLNLEIWSTLVSQAMHRWDWRSLVELFQETKKHELAPTAHILERLEKFRSEARQLLVNKEKGIDVPNFVKNPNFDKGFKLFSLSYRTWLLRTPVELPSHPWAQFHKKSVEETTDESSSADETVESVST